MSAVLCEVCGRTYELTERQAAKDTYCCGQMCKSTVLCGPGTEFKRISDSLRFAPTKTCGCKALRREMDALGVEGCNREFDRLCDTLREKYQATTWIERQKAKGWAVLTGLAFTVSWTDPIPDVLREAIRRASLQQSLAASAACPARTCGP